ncbi:hypothetical protein HanIR_Chr13g0624331 [Helianthus annuus]|nr:hypothetical protein HanIR_Chr13g0624331 [Helianthus annuus]
MQKNYIKLRPCVVVKQNKAHTMGHYLTRVSPVSMGRYCKSGVVEIIPDNAPSNH